MSWFKSSRVCYGCIKLTSFDGDPVGTVDGETDGLFDGDWLGLVVGCVSEYIYHERDRERVYKHISFIAISFFSNRSDTPTTLTSLDGDPVGTANGLVDGATDGPFEGDTEGFLLGPCDGEWLGICVGS